MPFSPNSSLTKPDYALIGDNNKPKFQLPSKFLEKSVARQQKVQEIKERNRLQSISSSVSPEVPSTTTNNNVHHARQSPVNGKPRVRDNAASNARSHMSKLSSNSTSSLSPLNRSIPKPNVPPPWNDTPLKAGTPKVTPSKTAQNVERLRLAREERRSKQAEVKKFKDGMDEGQQELLIYKTEIATFKEKNALQSPKKLANNELSLPTLDVQIRVAVRKRPLNSKETHLDSFDAVTTRTGAYPNAACYVHEPKTKMDMSKGIEHHQFRFDNVFDELATNEQIYLATAKPLVATIFEKGQSTLFCYGQTGSGKTFTIFGQAASVGNKAVGIYEYACRDVIKMMQSTQYRSKGLSLHCCFFEIYGGKVFDLFNNRAKLTMLEDKKGNVNIQNLTESRVTTLDDMLRLIAIGSSVRTTASTNANLESSRSHAIFQIILRSEKSPDNIWGKFSLIDLAGSERAADTTNASRQARIEGADINKSLLALKECIRALNKRQRGGNANEGHVPFRASKLTQVLRDSFAGANSKTVMVATISPSSNSCEHTLNTLRYADRVKEFKGGSGAAGEKVQASSVGGMESVLQEKNGAPNTKSEPGPPPEKAKVKPPLHVEISPVVEESGDFETDLDEIHRLSALEEHQYDQGVFASSAELHAVHSAVDRIFRDEELLLQKHEETIEETKKYLKVEEKLLSAMNDGRGNKDIDNYTDQLEMILSSKIQNLTSLYKLLADFKERLVEEEQASNNLTMKRSSSPKRSTDELSSVFHYPSAEDDQQLQQATHAIESSHVLLKTVEKSLDNSGSIPPSTLMRLSGHEVQSNSSTGSRNAMHHQYKPRINKALKK